MNNEDLTFAVLNIDQEFRYEKKMGGYKPTFKGIP